MRGWVGGGDEHSSPGEIDDIGKWIGGGNAGAMLENCMK